MMNKNKLIYLKEMLIWLYLGILLPQFAKTEIYNAEHRIGSLYRNKWHYLTHFCACEPSGTDSVGRYSISLRILRQTEKRCGPINFNVYDEVSWARFLIISN